MDHDSFASIQSNESEEEYHDAQEQIDPPPGVFRKVCTLLTGFCSSIKRCFSMISTYTPVSLLGATNINLVYFIFLLAIGGVLSLSVAIEKPPGLKEKYTNIFFAVCMGIAIVWMFGACACRRPPCGCCVARREEATQIPCYMIIGLTVFCLGSCFITGVDLMAYLYTLTCHDKQFEGRDISYGIYYGTKMIFLIFQLHFFCRFSDVSFYRRWSTSFFMFHIIAVNLSTWFYYIVDESVERQPNITLYNNCTYMNDMNDFVMSADSYLYPFNIEYTVMSSVLLLLMWFELKRGTIHNGQNQNRDSRCSIAGCLKSCIIEICNCKQSNSQGFDSAPKTMVFWKSAIIGFTIGVAVLTAYLVLIVLSAIEYYEVHSASYYYEGKIALFLVMLISSICGLVCLPRSKRRLKSKLHTRVDSILIMIGVSGCYVMVIFEVISSIYIEASSCPSHGSRTTASDQETTDVPWSCLVLKPYIAQNVIALFQFSFQTIFIVKALRRHKEEVSLGTPLALAVVRNTSAILSLGNLGIWTLDTFELKDVKLGTNERLAYGSYWKVLMHIAYPLCIFFRLHSAFCFFEIVINRFGVTVQASTRYNRIHSRQRPNSRSSSF